MTETLQLEEAVEQGRTDAPKLLVEWSSRWQEFLSCVRPALARSHARLAGEAPFGLVPFRIMIPSYVLEAFLIFAVIAVQVKIEQLRPYVVPRVSPHDVIYYSGDELPRTEDLGGAQAGASGAAGGDEAHHRTQTIKIARGGSLMPKVVDAPNLKLPSSRDAVANLLAIRPDPGPPPSEGMRSSRRAPNLQTTLVAPAPDVIRDYTRNGVAMDQVIAPAPTLSRTPLTAPNLSATVIPPAATNVARDHALVAPFMVPAVDPPAPNVSRNGSRTAPSLNAGVVSPAPDVARDKLRSAPNVAANVIPPAPGAASHELSRAHVQATDVAVVPPPVSAPERASTGNPKMALPAPAVIAPPPSDVSQDVRRLAGATAHDPFKAVVPPPPAPSSNNTGLLSSLIGKILGPTEVVQAPPSVSPSGTRTIASSIAPNVVVPPPSVGGSAVAGSSRGSRSGAGASLDAKVVAPPSSGGVSSGVGTRASTAPMLGPANVVAPPPSLSGAGGGTGTTGGGAGAAGGTLLANNIVPPPPSVSGGTNGTGAGLGRRGQGLGSPMDIGSNIAPATNGSSANNAGVVLSSQPGPKVGLPSSGGTGALAMSPSGGDKVGLGGSGGGTGIGRGSGPGSGLAGEGTGAAKSGAGRGSETNARGGISPSPGPGGAGNASSGTPAVPGVSVSGGTSMVTLPSFGTDADQGTDPAGKRSSFKQRQTFGVEVVATASSGGAFEPYKNLLHGEKHTIYPVPTDSTVVMEYSEEIASARGFTGKLTAPQAIRTVLPAGIPRARMVVTCTLDAEGNLRNLRVLDPGPAEMTAKVVAALRGWKFQPALRGDKPVEVTAILGFGVDTNDRF